MDKIGESTDIQDIIEVLELDSDLKNTQYRQINSVGYDFIYTPEEALMPGRF